jgi:DNA-binding LacI/PurR family transcriptional regulator
MKHLYNHKTNVSQADIAKMLNISTMTVSKALGNYPDISQKTRERVLDAASKIGYVSKVRTLAEKRKRSHLISVVIPKLLYSYHAHILNSIYETANQKGYQILLNILSSEKHSNGFYQKMTSQPVDGFLMSFINSNTNGLLQQLAETDPRPAVFVDFQPNSFRFSSVSIDDLKESYLIIDRVIQAGFDKVAFITDDSISAYHRGRYIGYQDALKKHNIEPARKWTRTLNASDKTRDVQAIKQMLESDDRPSAIFAPNEMCADLAYQAIKQTKLELNKDICVICFIELDENEQFKQFITLQKPAQTIGRRAVEMLSDDISNPSEIYPQKVMINAEIHIPENLSSRIK